MSGISHARFSMRRAQNGDDFWRVHSLLVETVPITPLGFNWDIRRWEGRRFYNANPARDAGWAEHVALWETPEGRLAAAVNRDGASEAHIQLHPDYRDLEEQIVAWAEEHLAAPAREDIGPRLHIFAYEYDAARQRLLAHRGYQKLDVFGVIRRLRFGGRALPPVPPLAGGYTLRTTDPHSLADCEHIARLLNAAFERDFHNAAEYQNFTRNAPSFRADLDLVAVAPDGTFGAYVGIPYDEANRRGIFEPVCTHPDHRRKGLALALMTEGLHRLRALGAADVTVETGDMEPANRLYDAVGFTEVYKGYFWRKLF